MLRNNLANIITLIRLIGSINLLSCIFGSTRFYIVYLICGISDILDGFVARKLNIKSELGSKLDSISDLIFYSIMMFKIWPILLDTLPEYIWTIIWNIVGVRIACYIYVALKFKTLASEHTKLNKICGFGMFLIPFALILDPYHFNGYALFLCTLSFASATYEFYLHIKKSTQDLH